MQFRRIPSLLFLACCACASPPAEGLSRRLPFHVAVAPCEVVALPPAGNQEAEPFLFRMNDVLLTRDIARQLGGDCFVQTTVLRVTDPSEYQMLSSVGRVNSMLQQAKFRSADLFLQTTLRYRPVIRSGWNLKVAPNLALFLVGGPLCWFLGDQTYGVEATLEARLYDLQALQNDGDIQTARTLSEFRVAFTSVDLNLIDRGDWYHYLLSIVIPPSFLALESDSVRAEVAREMAEGLTLGLEAGMRQRAGDIIVARNLVSFSLDTACVSAARQGGRVNLFLDVMQASDQVPGLAAAEVWCQESWQPLELTQVSPDEGAGGGGSGRRFRAVARGLDLGLVPTVKVRVRDLAESPGIRTYTLPIDSAADAEAALAASRD